MFTPSAQPINSLETMPQKTPVRLEYVDGLRALAALYVVLYHTYSEIDYRYLWRLGPSQLPHQVTALSRLICYAHLPVAMFIVLSGYCLMLPVVRSATGELKGGTLQFFKRRARRILPPYYASLAFSLLICQLPFIAHPHGIKAVIGAPFVWPSVITHLLLIHNLIGDHGGMINGPLWSIGLECQIYVFFPFLLLPLWRRYGNVIPVLAAFAIGFAPHFLAHGWLDGTSPWYLGLFSLGMIAAVIAYSPNERYQVLRARVPWLWLFLGCACTYFIAPSYNLLPGKAGDVLVGITVSCLLVYVALVGAKRNSRITFLEAPFLVWIGTFSYSIYLVHGPLQSIAHWLLNQAGIGPGQAYAILLFVCDPIIIGLAYLFHRGFERPFMPGSPKTERQAEEAAILSPAP